jgi:hypothetical protein
MDARLIGVRGPLHKFGLALAEKHPAKSSGQMRGEVQPIERATNDQRITYFDQGDVPILGLAHPSSRALAFCCATFWAVV